VTRLVGARTALRELSRDDAEVVASWRRDPAIASQMFAPPPRTIQDHLTWFDSMRAAGDRREFVIVRIDGPTEKEIGTVGLSGVNQTHRRGEFGIIIGDSDARRAGFALEASRLLLEYAFGTLALRRVFLQVFADNAPAIKLYDRLGFAREGTLRAHAVRAGVPVDVVVMGMLASEFGAGAE